MARNAEKAQSMLYRFRESQMQDLGILTGGKRPTNAYKATTIAETQKWRSEIVREISQKVSKIQDANLTEYQVRDLNDEINRLFAEKWKWEKRMSELGGMNYLVRRVRVRDENGEEVPTMRGYKYFGRARELPGVKELLEKKKPFDAKKKELEQLRPMSVEYYGYLDEEDGILLEFERKQEEREKEDFFESADQTLTEETDTTNDIGSYLNQLAVSSMKDNTHGLFSKNALVPSLEDVEQWLLERKQQELLEKYS